ncbi:MAG: glycosyl hydrolase family 9 [Synechococcales cyanobacterium CRU_2_2]|nr:glycosyl hydrolase family 9 [Synechococcales cyanobacterium CRU_2_2]
MITLRSGEYNKGWDAGLVPSGSNGTPARGSAEGSASSGPRFNYGEALQKSFLFYEAQRSGALPADNRIVWRGNSALGDGEDVGLDLTGGYFDAGDHTKFGFPMAATMTLLSWGVEEYRDGYGRSGQLDEALDAIRWGTDYLLKAHVTANGKTKEFWSQVGDPVLDQAVLELPELLSTARPAFKIDPQNPGTDLAAEAAAALAAASVIFRPTDKAYADRLLSNAIQLYEFADTYRRGYSALLSEETNAYVTRSGFEDELSWGAIWIHKGLKAQGSTSTAYLNKAESNYTSLNFGWTQDWDNKSQGAAVLLAQETGKERYRNDIEDWLGNWLPGGSVPRTSGGLTWLTEWGSLRLSANTAFVAGVYADTIADPGGSYSAFAEQQINYLLGDNPRNSSYVVGFGNNAPQRVHHQAAAGYTDEAVWESDRPNTNIIYGALVGGPAKVDDFSYADVRADFRANEVSLEYNAGYTGAVARMYSKYGGQPLSDAALDALPGIRVGGGALASLEETATEAATEPSTIVVGEPGAESVVLGNATGPLYATQGWSDFAWVENFEVGVDQLVLFGEASDYSIRRDATDTWIFRGTVEGGGRDRGLSQCIQPRSRQLSLSVGDVGWANTIEPNWEN